jgi:hypothetical protein
MTFWRKLFKTSSRNIRLSPSQRINEPRRPGESLNPAMLHPSRGPDRSPYPGFEAMPEDLNRQIHLFRGYPRKGRKGGGLFAMTSSPTLLSSAQKYALQSPCSEGGYDMEILNPISWRRGGFFLRGLHPVIND